MRVRVLGCSGAIARDLRTTSFLVDDDVLIDAGTGVGDLSGPEMLRVGDVFLTHAHIDHIACLPLLADATAHGRGGRPLRVHALAATLEALRRHVFNDHLWPDFTRLPSPEAPLVTLHPLQVGEQRTIGARTFEALPARHTVPAVGYAVRGPGADAGWWVFTGDTARNGALWRCINQRCVRALVIEAAFPDREREMAARSMHLCPESLAEELALIDTAEPYPVFITHTKPAEADTILAEIDAVVARAAAQGRTLHVRALAHGHVFEL